MDIQHASPASRSRSPPAKRQFTGQSPRADAQAPSPICPPHPGYMGGLCIRCGGLRPEGEEGAGVALRYIHAGLEVSQREAARLRRGAAEHAAAQRKLTLVLDLDHTLLNSTRFIDLTEGVLRCVCAGLRLVLDGRATTTWTRLRPGVRAFLEQAHTICELHIYTMGDRAYARAMAAVLDPEGRLFSGRIISAPDSTQRMVKDLDVVLGSPEHVLILDDTEAVWPRHGGNLLPIARYIYFRACAERFGMPRTSWMERGGDEDPEAGPFPALLRTLRSIHATFFDDLAAGRSADVRPLVAARRRGVLAGVGLLLSRIVPLTSPAPDAHPLWRLATACGATCTLSPGPQVTHVMAPDWTQKAVWGRDRGLQVVTPQWLAESAGLWVRADESRFQIPMPGAGAGGVVAPVPAPRSAEEELAVVAAAAGGGQTPDRS
ncbi:RNA polymerase II C-terminal domain phosphatase-like 4 [Auxenochlorella protothecoides]|uniref:protein-serine/threonine phosphatase n=1 Tax=Auxenochlorella protothecoides TaxID=3075 RepID=A0A087SLC5_AUXPR|nr:RNA polymerase II C-terminal domain phosphatase-like 4 [Auxenochlorella protothecoides]KFM26529.1 RNA polymerase II C-terminal domain phosphatase-like 4 [Auxenochlorella protothecoides]